MPKRTVDDRSEEQAAAATGTTPASEGNRHYLFSLGPFDTVGKDRISLNVAAAAATGIGRKQSQPAASMQQVISEQQHDQYSILLSRIFFHNSKNNRIGKHNVALVLVEALYSIKGLDYHVSSKITRSNSIGTSGPSATAQQFSARGMSGMSFTSSNQV